MTTEELIAKHSRLYCLLDLPATILRAITFLLRGLFLAHDKGWPWFRAEYFPMWVYVNLGNIRWMVRVILTGKNHGHKVPWI